jgi:hypothetical protein
VAHAPQDRSPGSERHSQPAHRSADTAGFSASASGGLNLPIGMLLDLLLDLLESGVTASDERRLVGAFAAASAASAGAIVWLLVSQRQPLTQTSVGLLACAGCIVVGAGGLLTSVLHLSRNSADRAFGIACLAANVAAVGIAVFGIVGG